MRDSLIFFFFFVGISQILSRQKNFKKKFFLYLKKMNEIRVHFLIDFTYGSRYRVNWPFTDL